MAQLLRDFEALGLTGTEARVLLAVLGSGSGSATEIARLARVPRPSVYQALEALQSRRLVEEQPGAVASWASVGREEVMRRLRSAQEEHLHRVMSVADAADRRLAQLVPEGPRASLSSVHVIRDPAEAVAMFHRLAAGVRFEALSLTKPPFADGGFEEPNASEIQSLGRDVRFRTLYEAPAESQVNAFLRDVMIAREAGEDIRIAEHLPLKLAVFDRRSVLVAIEDPSVSGSVFPITLLVEQPAYAELQAAAFEHLWSGASTFDAWSEARKSRQPARVP